MECRVRQLDFDPQPGERQVIPAGKLDPTPLHWQNFLQCVRTREKPVSDVEFGYHVTAALDMAMLSLLQRKVARYDAAHTNRYSVKTYRFYLEPGRRCCCLVRRVPSTPQLPAAKPCALNPPNTAHRAGKRMVWAEQGARLCL